MGRAGPRHAIVPQTRLDSLRLLGGGLLGWRPTDFRADHLAGNYDFYAAVLLTAFCSAIVRYWATQTVTCGGHGSWIETLGDQVGPYGAGPIFGKCLIDGFTADVVGIAFDGEV